MKIISEITSTPTGADIALATDDGNHMAMLRWNKDASTIGGMAGSDNGIGLATLRGVQFANPIMDATNMGTFAISAFMSACRIQAYDPDADIGASSAGKLAAWDDFLSSMGGPGAGHTSSRSARRPGLIDLSRVQVLFMENNGLINRAAGEIMMRKRNDLKISEPISGFDAISIHNHVAGKISAVRKVPQFDVGETRELLNAVTKPSSHAVMWYGNAEGQLKEDRAQVARAYPVLAGMIADNLLTARAVDAREAIQPMLIERTHLGKGGLKRLAKLKQALPAGRIFAEGEEVRGEDQLGINRARRFSVSGTVSLDLALRHLSELPPDRVPDDDASWGIYHDILVGCAIPLENALGIPVARTLSAVKSDWKSFHASLAKSADFPVADFDRRAIALTTIDAIAAIEDFTRTGVFPLLLSSIEEQGEPTPAVEFEYFRTGITAAARLILGESKNIAGSMFETARRYAGRINALSEAIGNIHDEDYTPPPIGPFSHFGPEDFQVLCDPFTARNGLVIRPLRSLGEMRRESSRLKHCVGRGGYDQQVRTGTTHLFSVQSPNGMKSFATIQLSGIPRDGDDATCRQKLAIMQNYARGNTRPAPDSLAASDEWFQAIKSGRLPIKRELMHEWQDLCGRHEGGQVVFSWKGVCGIRWEDQERRAAAWGEWGAVIGGSIGKSPHPGVLWKSKEIRALLGEMSPAAAASMERQAKEAREAAAKAKEAAQSPEISM